ncbi:NAD(P)-dependent alcohol dehydrogenase [Nocardia sp. NPDC050406]|uniref:NAD(P)-dependent alcohol dehydrogenase n=1 Tax=Nocardia sp. NPDC050406 TaxID=3364318 RepID=UPI0037BB09F6
MRIEALLSRDPLSPFAVEHVEIDAPRAGEILVRIEASGICHTDLVSRAAGSAERPVLLGHEGVGVVESLGAGVDSVRVGDRVVLTFRSCGTCVNCVAARPAHCVKSVRLNQFGPRADRSPRITVHGGPVLDGFFGQSSLARYALVTPDNVVVVDPWLDPVVAAPLGCGFQTGAGAVLNVLRPEASEAFVIYGAGAVGLAALLAARAVGVTRIVVVETAAGRRDTALRLGAAAVIDPTTIDLVSAVREAGGAARHALDTTGQPQVLAAAVRALAPGGTVVAVGLGRGVADLDVNEIVLPGKTIRGCLEGDSVPRTFIPRLVELYRAGRFPMDELVTAYPYTDIEAALEDQRAGKIVKPVLTW